MGATRFIDDGIMRAADDGGVELVGGRCGSCGLVSFPRAAGCARCGGEQITEQVLSRTGTLWTWTTQGFLPKRPYSGQVDPDEFEPFALGYVELPDGIRIEARLLGEDPEGFEIGQRMVLTTAPHRTDENGTIIEMFAFRPAAEVTA